MKIKLYYHKTEGDAEYLTDKYILCPDGSKEGVFEGAKYIVRFDGDIREDAELTIRLPDGATHPKISKIVNIKPFFTIR